MKISSIQAFEKAEIAKYSEEEQHDYEQSLKIYRDLKSVIDTAFDDGQTQRTLEIGKKLKDRGMDTDFIIETTGLTKEKIEKLQDTNALKQSHLPQRNHTNLNFL